MKAFKPSGKPLTAIVLSLSLFAAPTISHSSGESMTPANPNNLYSEIKNNLDSDAAKRAADCAAGKEGTLGEQMINAQKIHLEFASVKPNVEQLFSNASSCFSGLNDIIDLSYAIPSLSSIANAAMSAVQKYAEQKVCSIAEKASSMITTPVNDAIGKVNGYLNIDGQLNDLVSGGLSQIDPELGAACNPPPPANNGTYNLGGLFNQNQVDFETGTGSSTVTGNGTAQNNTAAVQAARQRLEAEQNKLAPAQNALQQAQNNLNRCQTMGGIANGQNCNNAQAALNQAQANLSQINNNINSYRQDLVNISGNSTANVGNSSGSMNFGNAANQNSQQSGNARNQVTQNSNSPAVPQQQQGQEPKKSGGIGDALKSLWN